MALDAGHRPPGRRDALSLLGAEHDMLLRLFDEYEVLHHTLVRDDGRKALLAGRICRELSIHAALEEQAFYPAIRAASASAPLLDDGLVEHEAQQLLIGQLRSLYPDDVFFGATIAVLGEETRHHIRHEQEALFDCARSCGLDLELLGRELVERRRALAHGAPPGAAYAWLPRLQD